MLYFYEDKKSSLLPKLLMKLYQDRNDIIFTGGAGNLSVDVKAALEESSECAVVFLDSVPQNEQVLSNYKALVGVASMYPDRVIPLPIVCAEYYFLKSLQYQPVFKDKELVEFCLSKKYYKDLPHLIGHEHHAVTFERFCKFVCRDYLHRCCYIRTKGRTPEDIRVYNVRDCRCEKCLEGCVDADILEKARRLAAQYPCVPVNPLGGTTKVLTWSDLKTLHRKLVAEFNTWAISYNEHLHKATTPEQLMTSIY